MKEPRRLLDEHQSSLETLLLTAMRADRPPPRARERALAGVSRWGVPVLLGLWTKSALASLAPWAKVGLCVVAASTVPVTVGVVCALQTSHDSRSGATIASPSRGAQGPHSPHRREPRDARRSGSESSTSTHEAVPAAATALVRQLNEPVQHTLLIAPTPSAQFAEASSRALGSAPKRTTPHPEVEIRERDSSRNAKGPIDTYPAPDSQVAQPRVADAEPMVAEPTLADAEPLVGVDAEAATLHAVRRSLATGDARGALAMLDEFHRRFPAAHLATEAAVLRVESLLVAGNRSAAEALGRSLVDASPYGPHARHIRALFDWKEE